MTTRFPSGLWAIVLVASILLNGIILGVLAAGLTSGMRLSNDQRDGPPPRFRIVGGQLPESVRGEVRDRLRERAQQARPLFAEARAADADVIAALTADPFDPEAARAAFARVEAARAALDGRANEMTISLFANLPPETREELVLRYRRSDRPGDFRLGSPPGRPPQPGPFIPLEDAAPPPPRGGQDGPPRD